MYSGKDPASVQTLSKRYYQYDIFPIQYVIVDSREICLSLHLRQLLAREREHAPLCRSSTNAFDVHRKSPKLVPDRTR